MICRDGNWALAPAYDLTLYTGGYNGEHLTSVNNSGVPDVEDMLTVGESIRISRDKGIKIIRKTAEKYGEILSSDKLHLLL